MPQLFLQRLKEVNFLTAITMIGATALLSALPFMVLMDSFAGRRIEDDLSRHMGLNAQAAQIVDGLFHQASRHSIPAIVLALVVSLAGMISLAGMVQHLYEQTFAQAHHRSRGQLPRLFLWIVILCGWLALDSLIGSATGELPGGVLLDAAAVLVTATGFFWISLRLLLGGHIPSRDLVLPAAMSGLLWLCLQGFAALYFSSTIINDSGLYGPVGVIFSLLTWFIAISAVIILGAMAGEVWRQRRQAQRSPPRPPSAAPAQQGFAQLESQPRSPVSS